MIEILRRESIAIGGVTVNAVVARTTITLSGGATGTQTTTSWTRPSDFLTVKEEHHSDVSNGTIRAETDYVATLQSLTPS